MNPRLPVAILTGKLVSWATQTFYRGGGTAAPGVVAERVDPDILSELTKQIPLGSILVSGTNGKTTTSRLLSHIFQVARITTIHNRSGSNLMRGLISTLIRATSPTGRIKADLGIFEVDEAALVRVAPLVRPKVIVINNLFRDQLDRYFEIDKVLLGWRALLTKLPKDTTICLNADDPRLADLGKYAPGKVVYYGIAQTKHKLNNLPQAADVLNCPDCNDLLTYDELYLGHQGKYFCANCQFKRPPLTVAASNIHLDGLQGVRFDLTTQSGNTEVALGVPGFFNVYNALAATSAALAANQELPDIKAGLAAFKSVFGRIERIPVGGKEILMTLVKNPTGFNEVLRLLTGTEQEHLMLALNDNIADGRDVSWIWDVDLERLAIQQAPITVSGVRSWDLANRLKYAGVNTKLVQVESDLPRALSQALRKVGKGKTLYLLPTYTAMLQLRQILARQGHVRHFLEEN